MLNCEDQGKSETKDDVELSDGKVPEDLDQSTLPETPIEILVLTKGKKNFQKHFNKLLRVDKEAFGDID